jgi:hypothetical protein
MVFGIKCRGLPSAEVYKSTGEHCPAFTPKDAGK